MTGIAVANVRIKSVAIKRTLLLIVFLLAVMAEPQQQPIRAQQPQPVTPRYALFEFFKIEPGKTADYRKIERDVWMPIHRERVKMGLIKSWSLWDVRLPGGVSREYDTMVITNFDKFVDLEKSYPPEVFSKTHPNTTADDLIARTTATRKTIRTEFVVLIDGTQPLPQSPSPVAYIGYMKPEPSGGYVSLERRYWKPIHQERVNRGILKSWALYQVRFPAGTNREYNFFTIQLCDKFQDLETQYPAGIWEKVHPTVKESEIGDRTNAARKMVRTEVLGLLENVQ